MYPKFDSRIEISYAADQPRSDKLEVPDEHEPDLPNPRRCMRDYRRIHARSEISARERGTGNPRPVCRSS